MKIIVETIPHEAQRYPTVGDYWEDPDGVVQIRVSHMEDWRYVILVAVHELAEMMLTRWRGIPEEAIGSFDMEFEKKRERRTAASTSSPRTSSASSRRSSASTGTSTRRTSTRSG